MIIVNICNNNIFDLIMVKIYRAIAFAGLILSDGMSALQLEGYP
jgi:hypothetical protein